MNNKLSTKEFLEKKEQLYTFAFDNAMTSNNHNFNNIEKEKFLKEYTEKLNELLSYDLSDIPAQLWAGMNITTTKDNIIDFSKSKANLDFSIINCYCDCNFKNCNVTNIKSLGRYLKPISFDKEVVEKNKNIFLSDNFTDEFKGKFYNRKISIKDIANFTTLQISELKEKQVIEHLISEEYRNINPINNLELEQFINIYNTYEEEYLLVINLINFAFSNYDYIGDLNFSLSKEKFKEQLKTTPPENLINLCNDYLKNNILTSQKEIKIEILPELFVRENQDLLLLNQNISEDIKEKYYKRVLTINDTKKNIDAFKNIPLEYFIDRGKFRFFTPFIGIGNIQKILKKHSDVLEYLEDNNQQLRFSGFFNKSTENIEDNFIQATKEFFLTCGILENFRVDNGEEIIYNTPEWLSSMNFKFLDKISTIEELMNYDKLTCILNKQQQNAINLLNIENIKKFDQETGFFSKSENLETFMSIVYYLQDNYQKESEAFKNGNLNYNEFTDEFAKCLNEMRKKHIFNSFYNYDMIKGDFRNNHPEIFIDENVPDILKKAFYSNIINIRFILNNPDMIPYLKNIDLVNVIDENITITPQIKEYNFSYFENFKNNSNFIEQYIKRYGNEKFLNLINKYGRLLSDLNIMGSSGEIEDEYLVEKAIRDAIYQKIKTNSKIGNYSYLENVEEFKKEHPEIFIDFSLISDISISEKARLIQNFYSKHLSFEDIKKYPALKDILKDKDLEFIFDLKEEGYSQSVEKKQTIILLNTFKNEKFLELCTDYGLYLNEALKSLDKKVIIKDNKYLIKEEDSERLITLEEIKEIIEEQIINDCIAGKVNYNENAPQFLKEKYPSLFLDEDAPMELKQYFYNEGNNYPLTFKILQEHKEWLPYLKGKEVFPALIRNLSSQKKLEMGMYFYLFGQEKAFNLGINRAETVMYMIDNYQTGLMKDWYDKTGGKFIPDLVVMKNIPLEEADKFLKSGSVWSKLMRIQSFSKDISTREAMLKAAYSFGAFDHDQRGFQQLLELLTGLPKKIDSNQGYLLNRLDEILDQYSRRKAFFIEGKIIIEKDEKLHMIPEKKELSKDEKREILKEMINNVKNSNLADDQGMNSSNMVQLLEAMNEEIEDFDISKPIISQIYRKDKDGSYILNINYQKCSKTSAIIRSILEKNAYSPVFTPQQARYLFSNFDLKYDKEFREFFLSNKAEILQNVEIASFIPSIQRRFEEIKVANCNRKLTLDLAVSYVEENRYSNIEAGNEKVSEISKIAGYSEEDFNILQQIFNYGKQRTYSSIPRIEKTSGKYKYEMLRLDDPLAMAIGTLTDCCQELNDCAETCMEHSMVDNNGRVFVVRDENDNIVAQSWVWRNKDVLCFDNIEIPERAFNRATKEQNLSRKKFTDEIYEIYKKAAHELIEKDEQVFKEYLDSGKITKYQYDGLKLGKITVGLGFNDIATSIKTNAYNDTDYLREPLEFTPPVELERPLYISDSREQYVLEEVKNRPDYNGETLALHSDDYIEHNDSNFTKKDLLTLNKLEIVTKENPRFLDTEFDSDNNIVSNIAINYDLDPTTTRIIMNPNFAIIYDEKDNGIRIGDLLFNTKVGNKNQPMDIEEKVILQINLALKQIGKDKNIDISRLDTKGKDMYKKAYNLAEEKIDIERKISHAR